MGWYNKQNGFYYEGDQQFGDIEVPTRPGPEYELDLSGESPVWVVGAAGLTQLREAVKTAIKARRDELMLLTPYNGQVFQSDLSSKIQIMVLASQTTLLPSAAKWRLADNTYADMTLDSFRGLMSAIMTREGQLFTNSSALQDAVVALTDPEAIRNFDITTGWPE